MKRRVPDEMLMPFGKFGPFQGDPRTIGKVPASYLDWAMGQTWIKQYPKVERYVEENREELDKELERGEQ
jgi:hypothetical protein